MKVLDIFSLYLEYQKEYPRNDYPELSVDNLVYVHDVDFWFQFNSSKLYDDQYELQVNMEAFALNDTYLRSILYHEFTHIYDSLTFKNKPMDEYEKIMSHYSEIHASYIEMRKRIRKISHSLYMQDEKNEILIHIYLQKEYSTVKTTWSNYIEYNPETITDKMKRLCYFVGHYKYLKDHYDIPEFKIVSPYSEEIYGIINGYSNGTYNLNKYINNIIQKSKDYKNSQCLDKLQSILNEDIINQEVLLGLFTNKI